MKNSFYRKLFKRSYQWVYTGNTEIVTLISKKYIYFIEDRFYMKLTSKSCHWVHS